jgi:hypothetical protein
MRHRPRPGAHRVVQRQGAREMCRRRHGRADAEADQAGHAAGASATRAVFSALCAEQLAPPRPAAARRHCRQAAPHRLDPSSWALLTCRPRPCVATPPPAGDGAPIRADRDWGFAPAWPGTRQIRAGILSVSAKTRRHTCRRRQLGGMQVTALAGVTNRSSPRARASMLARPHPRTRAAACALRARVRARSHSCGGASSAFCSAATAVLPPARRRSAAPQRA